MLNIIRRKIESATGVPPSIMSDAQFWAAITRGAGKWTAETLQAQEPPAMLSRKIVSHDEYAKDDRFDLKFEFALSASVGLKAIAFDRQCGLRSAAKRMSQELDLLGQPSDVFLKLINEGPATDLFAEIATQLSGGSHDTVQGPVASSPPASGAAHRYLELCFAVSKESDSGAIALYFDCDALIARAELRGDRKSSDTHVSRPGLRASVRRSTMRLDAVLDRIDMTVGTCARLEVGDVVPLAEADTGNVSLCIHTLSGAANVASGAMGVWHQNRALKLNTPVSGDFVKDLAAP